MSTSITPDTCDAGDRTPPISESETLYRRLLPEGWYRKQADPVIPQKYFMPRSWRSEDRPGDVDGISVNRACLIDQIAASRRRDTGERVPLAQFTVSNVHRIGLTVQPDRLPQDKSHAVIPELNSIDRRDPEKERKMEEWALALRNCSQLIRPTD